MKPLAHKTFVFLLASIIIVTLLYLTITGFSYYSSSLTERFYHTDHLVLKPSGTIGHGIAIIGSLMIIFGVGSYMLRKRSRKLQRLGLLKHWLEFHIFLCVLGPILILFHTTFKFGGVVAISFWSMVAVVLSGVIGRFIYLQIPRTLEGREMSRSEISGMKEQISNSYFESHQKNPELKEFLERSSSRQIDTISKTLVQRLIRRYLDDRIFLKDIKKGLKMQGLSRRNYKMTISLMKTEITLGRRIDMLTSMQNLLKYWHIAHMPFALIMLIIMCIHVAIVITFGYKWIF